MRAILSLVVMIIAFSLNGKSQDSLRQKRLHSWWNESFPPPPKPSAKGNLLPMIHVYKNKFVNARGDTILFRGVSIADPDKIDGQGMWSKQLFEEVKKLGSMLVRIPVHPVAWRARTPTQYMTLLDSAASWCTDLGMYIIIDWHSIGNLKMELFQDPMYNTTQKETYEFWQTMARHFVRNNTVAFYELFNEPTTYRGQLGNISWAEWKKMNEDIIHLIRAFDKDKVELVAGFDWAYDLTPLHEEPINAANIGYIAHPYPWKRQEPWPPKWEEDFGFAASQYPIIASEIGFGLRGEQIGPNHYGYQITKYLEDRGMSWVAWCYDPEWGPTMLKSWKGYELTEMGKFFAQQMTRK
jgi:hypothetical protein